MKAFSEMGLDPRLVEVLKKQNFVTATEVQEQAIPVALEGRDIIVRAKTGTGKTFAFLLPIKQRSRPGHEPETLILAPTRELALQIADVAKKLVLSQNRGIAVVYGGASINTQMHELSRNPDIVIGTPGRIIDLMNRGALRINSIRFLVLDEADTMFDMGFITDIEYILSQTPRSKQTMLFSATMPERIIGVAKRHMHDPVFLSVGGDDQIVVEKIKHYCAVVDNRMKFATLLAYVKEYNPRRAIIFVQTKYAANSIYSGMKGQGLSVILMHGGLSQAKREHSLREFKSRGGFLIATNVAARGLDIQEVSDIINFDVSDDPRVYVHRVGRSARMNANGRSFTIVNRMQENIISDIEDTNNIKFERINLDGSQYRNIRIFDRRDGGERFDRKGGNRFDGHRERRWPDNRGHAAHGQRRGRQEGHGAWPRENRNEQGARSESGFYVGGRLMRRGRRPNTRY